jgi:hypothetical protein
VTDPADRLQHLTEEEALAVIEGDFSYEDVSVPAQIIADRYFSSRPPEVRARAEAWAARRKADMQAANDASVAAEKEWEASRWIVEADPEAGRADLEAELD